MRSDALGGMTEDPRAASGGSGWWGPLDGPAPGAMTTTFATMSSQQPSQGYGAPGVAFDEEGAMSRALGLGIAGTGPAVNGGLRSGAGYDTFDVESTSRDEVPILLRQLDEMGRAVSARDLELQTMLGGASAAPNGELAALVEDIRSAIHKKQSFQAEAREHEDAILRLTESLEQTNRRVAELDEKVRTGAGTIDGSHGNIARPSDPAIPGGASPGSSADDGAVDGAWRDTIGSLEGELRRKSMRALELRRRVHWLETQLGQQLQANEQRAAVARASLEEVLARMEGRSDGPGDAATPASAPWPTTGKPVLRHVQVR